MKTKVLIIRFSSIGDIVLTTPVIRCLKQQLDGESELHVLTRSSYVSIFQHNPYIDHIHAMEDKVAALMPMLRDQNFDYVIDLHKNLRSRVVKNGLKALSFTFPKVNIEKWLLVNLKVDRMPDVHIVHRYFKAVEPLGIEYDGQGLDYFLGPNDHVSLDRLPESHRNGYVAFAIGGQHATKVMPVEKLEAIIQKVDYPVVLLGGKEDRENGDRLAQGGVDKVFNACGAFSLNESASLVQQADRVVTHDTGLMHVASAFRKHIVSIWGNTVPKLGMYPFLPKGEGASHIIEVNGLRCRPCSKIGFDQCPKKHFNCMNLINPQEVVDALQLDSEK